MLIINNKKTNIQTRVADTHFKRFKGLMFEKKKDFTYALIFDLQKESKIGSSVHMFFVFFPIFIIFLDSRKTIIDSTVLNPFTPNYTPKKPARYFIELPITLKDKIKLDDKVNWE